MSKLLFGIKRNVATCDVHSSEFPSFPDTGETAQTLGDKIIASFNYGADLGPTVSVDYDHSDSVDGVKTDEFGYPLHEVDILADPNSDYFDVAEFTGNLVESPSYVSSSSTEEPAPTDEPAPTE